MSDDSNNSNTKTPFFVKGGSLWDLSTYSGRYRHFMDFIDPRYLLKGQEELASAKAMMDEFEQAPNETRAKYSAKELWNAQRIHQSSFAADGTVIPMPFRMCGFIPFNSVVVVGMILPGLGSAGQAFFQWANQTHNAAINHYNRPSAEPSPLQDLALPYSLAVGSALSIVFGANAFLRRANFSPNVKSVLSKLVPFAAVATANAANIGFMRASDMTTGIAVQDENGTPLGVSKVAGIEAVKMTAISRIALSLSLLAAPPFLMPFFERGPFQRGKPANLVMQTVVMTAIFFAALPNMLALYPQNVAIEKSRLEPEFQKYDQDTLYFNKGL